jgi:regulator of sirC expression with transglutaminase-like and TPR domain
MARRREVEIDLAEAALLIAKEEYPRLIVRNYLGRLDDLAAGVSRRLVPGAGPRQTLETLTEYLFRVEGFAGNQDSFYDPRNSFLNDVLDRRLGIPISLSIVLIEVGRRLDLELDGIGFPGHFLVRFRDGGETLYLAPYNGGRIVNDELATRMPEPGESYALAAVTKRQILTRMLTNLKAIYLSQEDLDRAAAVIDRLLILNPGALGELRDRGLLRFRQGRPLPALMDLETYLRFAGEAPDAERIRLDSRAIWRHYARSN